MTLLFFSLGTLAHTLRPRMNADIENEWVVHTTHTTKPVRSVNI